MDNRERCQPIDSEGFNPPAYRLCYFGRAIETALTFPTIDRSIHMFKLIALFLLSAMSLQAADLPTKQYLNLASIKTMVAASEAKAKELNVEVTICIVDESGNLLFLEKADGATLNTIQFAQKKARHAAFNGSPSKDGADALKKGNTEVLAFPEFFPNQGGLPIKVDGHVLGGIAASGAKSEIDEQIAQAGIEALLKK
jgi:glc operon protein GlcG